MVFVLSTQLLADTGAEKTTTSGKAPRAPGPQTPALGNAYLARLRFWLRAAVSVRGCAWIAVDWLVLYRLILTTGGATLGKRCACVEGTSTFQEFGGDHHLATRSTKLELQEDCEVDCYPGSCVELR